MLCVCVKNILTLMYVAFCQVAEPWDIVGMDLVGKARPIKGATSTFV